MLVFIARAYVWPGSVLIWRRVMYRPTRSTQPCIPPGSLNRVPAIGWGKGGNVTSAGWQVTPCDPMWQVPVAVWQPCELLYTCYLHTYLLLPVLWITQWPAIGDVKRRIVKVSERGAARILHCAIYSQGHHRTDTG